MSVKALPRPRPEPSSAVIEALEEMLHYARAGEIHHLVAVGVNRHTRMTHRVRANALDVSLIGACSVLLSEMQADFSDAAEVTVLSPPPAA